MERNFSRLDGPSFDLLVVGGGIYGVWTAYDAALRGLRVAIVEQRDWSAGTSQASSKLIHGGLRYLEHGRLGLVRRGLTERRRLLRIGRHRVRTLRFVLPVYKHDRVGRLRLRLGLWVYDRLGGGRSMLRHEARSRASLIEEYDLEPAGLLGGFTFGDGQTDDARFVVEILDGAMAAGAVAVNRARATKLLFDGERVGGAVVEDLETGRIVEVRAGVTVDCCGPWCEDLAREVAGAKRLPIRRTKGVHLVLPALPTSDAFLLMSAEDRRIVFLLPWYGRTLVGTTDTEYYGDAADVRVEPDEVDHLLACANRTFDKLHWTTGDVISSFAGVRTLAAGGSRSPSAVTREWRLGEPLPRLLTSVGGKFTSARSEAARIVDRALGLLERRPVPCATGSRPLPWSPKGSHRQWSREMLRIALQLGIDEETLSNGLLRYGVRIEQLFDRVRHAPELARRITPNLPFFMAEVVHAAADEMALSLEDVLRRRVPLLLLCRLDEPTVRDVADRVGAVLGWTGERRRREVQRLMRPPRSSLSIHETS